MLLPVDRPSLDVAAAAAKAAAEARQAEAQRALEAAAVAKDVLEPARSAASPFSTPASPPSPATSGLSPAELEAAQQAIALASDGRDAEPILKWLRAHPDPAEQDQFFDLMFKFGAVAGEILDSAQRLPEADQATLARALDHAYRSGAVTVDELKAAVERWGYGARPGESHVGLADIVGQTGNPELIAAYAEREIEILLGDEEDAARAQGVATALAHLSPSGLQRFLAAHPDGVRKVIELINADPDAVWSTAHADLLDVAAAIVPPTPESIALFDDSIAQIGENRHTREAMARFFERHADAVLGSLQADSAKLTVDGQGELSSLFARLLFTEPSYDGQEAFGTFVLGYLSRLGQSLDAHALENPPSIEAQRSAQLLGSIVGTIEGGFQIAVDELKQRNEAVEKMTKLLFKAGSLIPDGELPGLGILKDVAVDELEEWVTDWLKEKPRDASEALPFHALLGERIDSVVLTTIYDAARSEAFTNRGVGLVP